MPVAGPSSSRQRNRLMRDAAADGMVITYRCGLCKRSANYWAADLVAVVGALHEAHIPPWPCSKCGTKDYVSARPFIPSAQQMVEGFTVRRPVRQVLTWVWRDERA